MAHPALSVVRPIENEPEEATERIWTCATPSLARAIDDYFHENRFKTRSAAVRHLIEMGLASKGKGLT
jgi:metal-responsive CopG/Arc/MetJ family transcriptional regulator